MSSNIGRSSTVKIDVTKEIFMNNILFSKKNFVSSPV